AACRPAGDERPPAQGGAGSTLTSRFGWHALRYSEGRAWVSTPCGVPQGVLGSARSAEYLRACLGQHALRSTSGRATPPREKGETVSTPFGVPQGVPPLLE